MLLEHNYRSTQSILDVANAVISNNRNRTPKKLRTDNGAGVPATVYAAYNEVDEADWVGKEIKKLLARREYTLGDFAVTYRTNAQSRVLEEMFVSLGLKHRLIGATRFYDRKEVKDSLAYLRLIHNPADSVALERIINVPTRGIGQKTHEALRNWAQELGEPESVALMILHHGLERASKLLGRPLPAGAAHPPIAGKQLKVLADFSALLENWVEQEQAGRYASVAELLDAVLTQSDYIRTLRDGTEEGEDRFENLQQLRVVAALYVQGMPNLDEGGTPLSQFLQETALVSDTDALDDNGGAITLLTLHTAKGLEYPVVFIVGLEEGILPHSRSIEADNNNPRGEEMAEERRLFYVGVTRAKRRLYLLHALRRSLWGGSELQTPSRFLDEIPEDLLAGMVDKRGRREDSARRMTSWDETDQSLRLPRSQTGGQWSGRSKSTPWPSSSQPDKKPVSPDQDQTRNADQPKQAYWSPGAAQQPINRKGATGKPATPAPTKFNRRDSVQHPSFGVGTVIESVTSRDGEEVTVAFPGVGIKRLMAEYLKKVVRTQSAPILVK
ncbi:MAG: ATP-binding domain-containing protein [Anaerolineales bacterium]|nr:ATP-binding domain-containing protein [Anaerolineales bacterium]